MSANITQLRMPLTFLGFVTALIRGEVTVKFVTAFEGNQLMELVKDTGDRKELGLGGSCSLATES